MTRRKKIWLGLAALMLAGLIAIIAFSGMLIRPALQYAIRGSGFPNATIEAVYVTPNGILLENVALDGEEFSTVETAQVTGSWLDILFRRHIRAVELRNVELSGEIDERGQYIIAGWNASLAAEEGSESSGLTIENIDVNGLTLDFETPEGAIRIEGKLALQSKVDKSRDFQANLWGRQKQLALNATAIGTISPNGQWHADIELLEGRVDFGSIKATRASGALKLQSVPNGITYVGKMAAGGVRIQDIPFQDFEVAFDSHKKEILEFHTSPTGHDGIVLTGRLLNQSPLTVEASAAVANFNDVESLFSLEDTQLDLLAKAAPAEISLSAPFSALSMPEINLHWKLSAGTAKKTLSGTATYTRENGILKGKMEPAEFSGPEIDGLFPLDDMDLKLAGGTLGLSAEFETVPNASPLKIGGKLKAVIKNGGGFWQEYPFKDMNGTLELTQLLPWTLAKNQTLKIGAVGTGINLTDGTVTFDGQQNGTFNVHDASFKVADGKISADPLKWNPDAKENKATIRMENVDLQLLAQSVGTDGFTAQGRLSGSLPVSFTPKGIVFRDGVVTGGDDGFFRYTPKTYPAALQGDDVRMNTVRTALSDFRYKSLEITLGGSLDGDLKTRLKASGRNPAFADRDINFNLNLEGALVSVMQEALQPGKITDRIGKSLSGGRP